MAPHVGIGIGVGMRRRVVASLAPIAYDFLITSDATWASVFANSDATLAGRVIAVAPGTYTDRTLTSRTPASPVTIAALFPGNRPVLPRLIVTGCTNLVFDGISVVNSNPGLLPSLTANAAFKVDTSTATIRNCRVNCDTGPTQANKLTRLPAFSATGSTLVFEDNRLERCWDGFIANSCTLTSVARNHIERFVVDVFTGLNTDWNSCVDNTATYAQGWLGKRLRGPVVISGVVNVGDYFYTGSAPNLKGGQVIAVGSDGSGAFVDIAYNGHEAMDASGTLTNGANSITYSSLTSEYDGPHGDFFQPLINTSTRNHAFIARRNRYWRTNPVTHGVLNDEGWVQGFLLQRNGSSFYHAPCEVESNIIAGGMPIGLTLTGCRTGFARFNTAMTIPFTGDGAPSRIRYSDCQDFQVNYNTADQIVDVGGHGVNVTAVGNVNVTRASYGTEFPAFPAAEPFDLLSHYAPASGGAVNAAFAGALRADATYRAIGDLPAISLVNAVSAFTGASASSGSTGNLASDGSANQYLIVVVTREASVSTPVEAPTAITYDGLTVTVRIDHVSTSNFIRQTIAAVPIGTRNVSAPVNITWGTTLDVKGAVVVAAIVKGLAQVAPTVRAVANLANATFPRSETETVAGAAAVIAAWGDGISSTALATGAGSSQLVRFNDNTASCAASLTMAVATGAGSVTVNSNGPATGSRTLYGSLVIPAA